MEVTSAKAKLPVLTMEFSGMKRELSDWYCWMLTDGALETEKSLAGMYLDSYKVRMRVRSDL